MKDIRRITLHGTFLEVEFDYWRSRRCSKCGKRIWLVRAPMGRYIPIEERKVDGHEDPVFVSHFSECQAVREFKNN